MIFTLIVLSIASSGCFATPVEVVESKIQKRSIGEDLLGGYYGGLSSAALAVPSLALSAPSITSHTHTHSTAVIDRPYPVPIQTPVITSASILPSTLSSYNYGLSSYPFGYPYGSLGYRGNYYSGFGKYYARSSYPTIYKKSFYSLPSYKYKW